jgi:hypothetical protein
VSKAKSGDGDEDTHSSKCDRAKQDMGRFQGELGIAMTPAAVVHNHCEPSVHLQAMAEGLIVQGDEATAIATTEVWKAKYGPGDAHSSKLTWADLVEE